MNDDHPINPELADGPNIGTMQTTASTLQDLVKLQTVPSADTEQQLSDYRAQFNRQLTNDLNCNLQQLWRWTKQLDGDRDVLRDPQIRDGLQRLEAGRILLSERNAWSSNAQEIDAWNAFHQFYCDALALGQRLLHYENGKSLSLRSRRQKRFAPGAHSYAVTQAVHNAIEQCFPGMLDTKRPRHILQFLLYQAVRSVVPRPIFRWDMFLEKGRRIYTSRALHSYSQSPDILRIHGKRAFLDNTDLFDHKRQRTRHNLILAVSHRHAVVDVPIIAQALTGIETTVWVNALFFPKSASHDPKTVPVSPAKKLPMQRTLDKSAHLVIDQMRPLVIFVDGGSPYLPYGQQMRIKRGIRLLCDHLRQASEHRNRKTYVLPISLDDTVSFLCGIDDHITVTFHAPIDVADFGPAPEQPDRDRVNYGDPLLNHLEAHFLWNTGQIRHGWKTPNVIDTIRHTQHAPKWAAYCAARLHPTMLDMAKRR